MTWEEEFLTDGLSEFHDDKGRKIGEVKQVGGSWQVRYKDAVIAFRPDKTSAQQCLSKYHREAIEESV